MAAEAFVFESFAVLPWGGLVVLVLAIVLERGLARQGVARSRRLALVLLRVLVLLLLVVLLARPTRVEHGVGERDRVVVLLDRSASMGLVEQGSNRFERGRELVEGLLLPAIASAGWRSEPYLFAGEAHAAPDATSRRTLPDGRQTDFGTAITTVMAGDAEPPLAVLVVSDGVATRGANNRAALATLIDAGTPVIGIALGEEAGAPSLSLLGIDAPATVAPLQTFRLGVRLEAGGGGRLPAADLLLLRDGQVVESRRIEPGSGPRLWRETFERSEEEEGVVRYTAELQLAPELVSASRRASTPVRVSEEKDFRVLFAQGALSWNFKFFGRALRTDPTLRLTGLTRTSERSMFRQNVESPGELIDGFPEEPGELSPFRVIVLSGIGPGELEPRAQEAIARFVGELGGGLLMIGGQQTFNAAWQDSRLEALLPVTFDDNPGVVGLDRPFELVLEQSARRHPVFQLDDTLGAAPWDELPTFVHYGRVRSAKSGATVWARHGHDRSSVEHAGDSRRILMASQRYGAGLSAVLCLENLWRWRLAEDSEPDHFDRFVKQLLRFLAEGGSQEITLELSTEEPVPGTMVRVLAERRPRPSGDDTSSDDAASDDRTLLRVRDPERELVLEQEVELPPGRPVELEFQATHEGTWTLEAASPAGLVLGSRQIEIRAIDAEMARTGRDLDNLRQWAGLSGGFAMPAEALIEAQPLVDSIRDHQERLRQERERRHPMGLGWPVLTLLLALLATDWTLRKVWGLR